MKQEMRFSWLFFLIITYAYVNEADETEGSFCFSTSLT